MSALGNLTAISCTPQRPLTLARIEEMLLFAATLVDERGPVMQPLLDRMESEYVAAKQRAEKGSSAIERARKLIAAA